MQRAVKSTTKSECGQFPIPCVHGAARGHWECCAGKEVQQNVRNWFLSPDPSKDHKIACGPQSSGPLLPSLFWKEPALVCGSLSRAIGQLRNNTGYPQAYVWGLHHCHSFIATSGTPWLTLVSAGPACDQSDAYWIILPISTWPTVVALNIPATSNYHDVLKI